MNQETHRVNRRTFVKTLAAAATVVGAGTAHAADRRDRNISITGAIPTRTLGKTGHTLPVLGMGGAVMQDKHANLLSVPKQSFEDRAAMIRHGYDRGLRYVDTARGYGISESIIGAALKGVRDDVYLATKIWAFTPEDVRKSVETSLKELQTDYVDAIQIHGVLLRRLTFDDAMKLHGALLKLRDEGLVRFIGVTGHDSFEKMYKMISTGGFDQVLIAYGYLNKGMRNILSNTDVERRNMCIAKAHELGMGIVSMKVMGCYAYGHNAAKVVPEYESEPLSRLPGAAIRWVLSDPRISILNIGVCLRGDIDSNIATLSGNTKLSNADRLLLADFSRKAYESRFFEQLSAREGRA